MEQRQTTEPATVTTTEFGSDAVKSLSRAVRRAVGRESAAVGTEHLLHSLLSDTEEPGSALVPGGRESSTICGHIRARDERHWARDDSGRTAPAEGTDDTDTDSADGPHALDDAHEVDAVWREAVWIVSQSDRSLREEDARAPEPSGALRLTLLGALRLAREEGAHDVHERHLARALLETPGSRALEALSLRRVDVAAAASALDAQAEAVRAGAEPWPAEAEAVLGSVKLLRGAGLLGERGVWWTRGMMSWMARTAGDGSPLVLVISNQAQRQAVRHGRTETEPVDLLLAVMAVDRALTVAGVSLPEELLVVNSAADTLRSAGIRQADLVRAATAAAEPPARYAVPGDVDRSAETDKVVASARLLAAERRDETAGTAHVLIALLDAPEGPAAQLLRECGADPAALRTRLDASLGATPAA
ncbi:Clp protease N-terminal domain-containing protein [Streptomyces sp. NPDC060366]|uniref:Clp protease N-terminal domain-containing protein n=1 Tax=Streptomyces sp. NPDC060366 TaxID=3347105 RepID=UPI003661DD6A